MTTQFEHENDPLPCCPYCGMYDNEIFAKVEDLLFGSYVCFNHDCPGCEARYAVRFYPSRHTGFNTGFVENQRHAFKDADPQNTADPGQGCDIPSPVKSPDVQKPRRYDTPKKLYTPSPIGDAEISETLSDTAVGSMPNSAPPRTLEGDSEPSHNGTHERYATVTPSAAAAAFRRVIATEGNMSNDGDAVEIAQEALMLFCEILDLGHVANCEGCGKTLFEGDLGYRDADGDITWCGDCAPTYGEHLADIRASDAETLKAHAGFVAKIRKYLDDGGDPCAHYTFPL